MCRKPAIIRSLRGLVAPGELIEARSIGTSSGRCDRWEFGRLGWAGVDPEHLGGSRGQAEERPRLQVRELERYFRGVVRGPERSFRVFDGLLERLQAGRCRAEIALLHQRVQAVLPGVLLCVLRGEV